MENNLTKLNYDQCSYNEELKRSMGPGFYATATLANDCMNCSQDIPSDPYLRYQKFGSGTCPPGSSIDDSSELSGRSYKTTKCSNDQYLPGKYSSTGLCKVDGSIQARDCGYRPTESTRISNNACNLRGTGINRWQWLCDDVQQHYTPSFNYNVSSRIVMKDDHVPCIEKPLDETNILPPINNFDPSYKPKFIKELNTPQNKYFCNN